MSSDNRDNADAEVSRDDATIGVGQLRRMNELGITAFDRLHPAFLPNINTAYRTAIANAQQMALAAHPSSVDYPPHSTLPVPGSQRYPNDSGARVIRRFEGGYYVLTDPSPMPRQVPLHGLLPQTMENTAMSSALASTFVGNSFRHALDGMQPFHQSPFISPYHAAFVQSCIQNGFGVSDSRLKDMGSDTSSLGDALRASGSGSNVLPATSFYAQSTLSQPRLKNAEAVTSPTERGVGEILRRKHGLDNFRAAAEFARAQSVRRKGDTSDVTQCILEQVAPSAITPSPSDGSRPGIKRVEKIPVNTKARHEQVPKAPPPEVIPPKPRRPLSAYNLYFRDERAKMLGLDPPSSIPSESYVHRPKRKHCKTHGKVGFAEMAKMIAESWRNLDNSTRAFYDGLAVHELEKYTMALEEHKAHKMVTVPGNERKAC